MVTGLEHRHHLVAAARQRHRAEALGQLRSQRRLVEGERSDEADMGDAVERHQPVAQSYAVAIGLTVDADVGEAAERDQVVDGLAHVGHQQRLADPRLDQREQRRFGHRRAVGDQPDVGEAPSEQRFEVGGGGRGGRDGQRQRGDRGANQNTTRFRISRA